jgi:hypothetical protein
MHMQGQDWNEVVLRKKHTTTSQATSSAAVNAALRSGMVTGMLCKVHYVVFRL